MLEFVNAFQGEHQRTKAFGEILKKHDLLEASQANVSLADGSQRQFSGFHCISRERLKVLPSETIIELVANDAMELIYLHLDLLPSFDGLLKKLSITPPVEPLQQ